MTKWRVAAVLSIAQFLMVLDSTVMNVSVSQLVALCALWLRRQQERGLPALVGPQLFGILPLRSAVMMFLVQMLIIGGLMFVTPLFLQIVLGYDALRTGIAMLPLSVALLVASFAGAPLGARFSPRLVVQVGMAFLFAGSLVVLTTIDVDIDDFGFGSGLALFGVGLGLLASQLANVTQSSVGEDDRSEVGDLQYASQNLGIALGTALVGPVLLGSLLSGVESRVYDNPGISAELEAGVGTALESGLSFIPANQVEQAALDAGFEGDEVDALADDYQEAQVRSLRLALGVLALAAVAGVWFTRGLPGRAEQESAAAQRAP